MNIAKAMPTTAKLELIALSQEDAVGIEAAGADRIELCSAIELGGLTPTLGLVKAVRAAVKLPIRVMVRGREGDFVYTSSEKRAMAADLESILAAGADGVVLGATTAEGRVDEEWIKTLFDQFGPFKMTYSRAFDALANPFEAAKSLVGLGVDSILTSGGQNSAESGAETVAKLQTQFGDQIQFVLAGKVRAGNAVSLAEKTGVPWLHAGLFTLRHGYPLGHSGQSASWPELDRDAARQMVQAMGR